MLESFEAVDRFDIIADKQGYKQSHLLLILQYTRLLQDDCEGTTVGTDLHAIEHVRLKLDRAA